MFKSRRYEKKRDVKERIVIVTRLFDYIKAHFRLKGEPFDFENKEHLEDILNDDYPGTIIMSGRQVEKSTTVSNRLLGKMVTSDRLRALYCAPVWKQASTFSIDRFKPLIESSPQIARAYGNRRKGAKISVGDIHLSNGSYLAVRSLFQGSVDSVRGLSTDFITYDEVQDILWDVIPVVNETLSHSFIKHKETGKRGQVLYTGTPKTLDNTIQFLFDASVQNTLTIKCPHCGGWIFSIELSYENIHDDGFMCHHCNGVFDVHDHKPVWIRKHDFSLEHNLNGYHITQVFMPWITHNDLLEKAKGPNRYPQHRFYNEVLGLSFDNSEKVFTLSEFRDRLITALPGIVSWDDALNKMWDGNSKIYIGVDWGTGQKSYTVITIFVEYKGKFSPIAFKRFVGNEADREYEFKYIRKMMKEVPQAILCSDYGHAYHENTLFVKEFGVDRVRVYYHSASSRFILRFDEQKNIFVTDRTEVIQKLVTDMKVGEVMLYGTWDMFQDYVKDFIALTVEYNERMRKYMFSHKPTNPDDAVHASVYCYMSYLVDQGKIKAMLGESDDEEYQRSFRN